MIKGMRGDRRRRKSESERKADGLGEELSEGNFHEGAA